MAGDKFKGLFDFINNFGDATVNVSVHEPASGKTSWIFGRSENCDFVYPAPKGFAPPLSDRAVRRALLHTGSRLDKRRPTSTENASTTRSASSPAT